MDKHNYQSLRDAYKSVYLREEESGESNDTVTQHSPHHPYPHLVIGRPVQVKKTQINIDVTKDYVGPGGVEKAYYTYPAGFDPTNREDVIKDKDYDGSVKRTASEEVQYSDLEEVGDFLIENGFVSNPEDVDAFYAHMSDEWKSHILESMKQARKNVGASKCWDGYKASGTKMKNGKKVPDCKPA